MLREILFPVFLHALLLLGPAVLVSFGVRPADAEAIAQALEIAQLVAEVGAAASRGTTPKSPR